MGGSRCGENAAVEHAAERLGESQCPRCFFSALPELADCAMSCPVSFALRR